VAGKDQQVTIGFNSATYTVELFVSPARFTAATAISFWSNAGQKNNFGF